MWTPPAVAGLLLLTACASPPRQLPEETARPSAATAPAAASLGASGHNDATIDASYDWRPLVLAPFGTRLVDSPVRLHEVLLFREPSLGAAEAESKDCYAVDGTVPTFVGLAPEEYLMCFEHDRLDRIDASVRVAADDAPRIFRRACVLWLGHATPQTGDDICEGRDGDIAFSARLAIAPGERMAELVMTLTDAARRDAEREPPGPPESPSPAAP